MSRRRPALSLALLIATGVLLLVVLVVASPRLRPDLIHLNLRLHDVPMRSTPVKLVDDTAGKADCRSEGMPGVTDNTGSHRWMRLLPERPLLSVGRQVDEIAICAQLHGQHELLWRRSDLPVQERLDLTCDAGGIEVGPCETRYTVTLWQTAEFTVMTLLFALVARVLWNRKSALAVRAGLVLVVSLVLVSILVFSIAMSVDLRRLLAALLVGGLVGLHIRLSWIFEEVRRAAEASETENPGVFGP